MGGGCHAGLQSSGCAQTPGVAALRQRSCKEVQRDNHESHRALEPGQGEPTPTSGTTRYISAVGLVGLSGLIGVPRHVGVGSGGTLELKVLSAGKDLVWLEHCYDSS